MKATNPWNLSLRKWTLAACLLAALPASARDWSELDGGNSGVGGGNLARIDEASLRQILKQGTLKAAMLNYLNTLDIRQIPSDHPASAILEKLIVSGDLSRDIEVSSYVEGSCQKVRADAKACTEIGRPRSEIRFDVPALAKELKEVTGEQGLIRLAALTIHEHVHHFQAPNDGEAVNEAQANNVAAYVLITARFAKAPSLQWDPNPVTSNDDPNDSRRFTSLPQGTSITIRDLDFYILKGSTELNIPMNALPNGGRLYCDLVTSPKTVDRILRGTIQVTLDGSEGDLDNHYFSTAGRIVTLNGSPTDLRLRCGLLSWSAKTGISETTSLKSLKFALGSKATITVPKPVEY